MSITAGKWASRAGRLLAAYPTSCSAWREADGATIRGAIRGVSPYTGNVKRDGAAKVVFNISSVHVPSLAASQMNTYLNRYDVSQRIGGTRPSGAADARENIDRMLASLIGSSAHWQGLYYAAVELNGAGIRYYGDVCLVLRDSEVGADTKVLNRNSFDLICEPLRSVTSPRGTWDAVRAEQEAAEIAGTWDELGDMALCKILKPGYADDRRLTIGAISVGVLADEDYLEVIREKSFTVGDLAEARLAAADAAVDGLVADRLRRGPLPSWTELLWRHRRRKADEALKARSVPTRVVVSAGRVR